MSNKIKNIGYYIIELNDWGNLYYNKDLKALLKEFNEQASLEQESEYIIVHKDGKGKFKVGIIKSNIDIIWT
jgi:hypothetical protein